MKREVDHLVIYKEIYMIGEDKGKAAIVKGKSYINLYIYK